MKNKLLLGATLIAAVVASAGIPIADDFDDNTKDPAKWGQDYKTGNGALTETNQRLEYTCRTGTGQDELTRPWIATVGPTTGDWYVQLDVGNSTSPNQANQVNSFGISVMNSRNLNDEVYLEMYASQLGGPPERKGFNAALYHDNDYIGEVDTGAVVNNAPLTGAIQIRYEAATKILRVYYATEGYNWIEFGAFGIGGSGGNHSANWGLTDSDLFYIAVYGYSERMSVSAGQMWADNFAATGLVPVPTPHDLAIIRMKAPKVVNLGGGVIAQGQTVVVQIQNRSPHNEVIPDLETLGRVVTLDVISLGDTCPHPSVGLIGGPPNVVPRTLKPKQKLNVFFNVIFDCANDPAKGPGHEDFRYVARVNHVALDDQPDTHQECDVCPRPPLPGGVDPNPDPNKPLKDKGCGNKDKATGQLGADILTDVVVKQ